MYPAARVGKITGMLLEQDIDQIVPLFFFPEMVRYKSAVRHTPCHCSSEPSWLYFLIGKAEDQGPDLRDNTELTLTHRSPFQLTSQAVFAYLI